MPGDNKFRILYIMKYLLENTDDEHYTTITEILAYLGEQGITANRRTIPSDIKQLKQFGLDIIEEKSTQNRYHIGCRAFELPELKLLVDAVQSSRFITKTKSKELIGKLCTLTSVHESELLKRRLYIDKRIKPLNEKIFYSVDLIQNAIVKRKMIAFQYYMYNANKKKVLKHGGKIYTVSPYDLIWNDDSYYMVGYSKDHGDIRKFRVDRMESPKLLDAAAHLRPKNYNIETYSKQVFSMYDGKQYTVELECKNELMNTIVDRFGTGVNTRTSDPGHFIATVSISASPTFYGWLFIFAGKIKVLSPPEVKDEYKRLAGLVCDI